VLPRTPGNNVYVGFMVWSNFTATKCRGVVSLNQVIRSEERFSRNAETDVVCRLLLEKKNEFLNGVALTLGTAIVPSHLSAAFDVDADPEKSPDYYPPARTGMRGNHDGSFTFAHKLRDGDFWEGAGKPEAIGETYDLVVVGAGISGLAAAHFYRKSAGPQARILILDNHDDFGGHAKRNEFGAGGRK